MNDEIASFRRRNKILRLIEEMEYEAHKQERN